MRIWSTMEIVSSSSFEISCNTRCQYTRHPSPIFTEITRWKRRLRVWRGCGDFIEKRSQLPEIWCQLCRFQVSLTEEFAKRVFVLKKLLVRALEYCVVITSHFKPVAASLIRKSGSIISIYIFLCSSSDFQRR